MSAFLGPIHHWLYGKIIFQNDLVDLLETTAKEENWLPLEYHPERYGQLEEGDLEEIVDETNIHGWLQERVSLVENRLAYLITEVTVEHPDRMEKLGEAAFNFGKGNALGDGLSAKDVYRHLENLLLNGMPCDHVNVVREQEEEYVIWQQVTDIHKQYWDAVGGNVSDYYVIKDALIRGVLEGSGYSLTVEDDMVYIIK